MPLLSKIKTYLSANYQPITPSFTDLEKVLRIRFMMSFALVALLLLATNVIFFRQRITAHCGNLIIFAIFYLTILFNTIYLWRTKKANHSVAIYLTMSFIVFLYSVHSGGMRQDGIYLLLLFPLLAFFLSGGYHGSLWSVSYIVAFLGLMLCYYAGFLAGNYPLTELSRVGLVLFLEILLLAIFSYYNDKNRRRYFGQLMTDSLTGLYTREKFLLDMRRRPYQALILINIDKFSDFCNFYGLVNGDEILRQVACRIQPMLSEEGYGFYRLHNDDFAVLVPDLVASEGLDKLCKDFLQWNHSWVYRIRDFEVNISMTLGISIEQDNLLHTAELALRHAKKKNREYFVYHPAIVFEEQFDENQRWVSEIRKAIFEDRVLSFYQPIVNNHTGKIEKYESLIRIIGKDGAIYAPHQFLEIAKRSKLYRIISKIVIGQAMAIFSRLNYAVSINLSANDIADHPMNYFLTTLIEQYNMADKIIFELLESESITDSDNVSNFIDKMKKMGCKFAIDDFGSGYSNFINIQNFDFDIIKIDGVLIKNIDTNPVSQIIVENIVNFAQRLNIQTVAEFVHNRSVYEKVCALGIDYSQGYYLGRPIPEAKL